MLLLPRKGYARVRDQKGSSLSPVNHLDFISHFWWWENEGTKISATGDGGRCNARISGLVNLETISVKNDFLMKYYSEGVILTKL